MKNARFRWQAWKWPVLLSGSLALGFLAQWAAREQRGRIQVTMSVRGLTGAAAEAAAAGGDGGVVGPGEAVFQVMRETASVQRERDLMAAVLNLPVEEIVGAMERVKGLRA